MSTNPIESNMFSLCLETSVTSVLKLDDDGTVDTVSPILYFEITAKLLSYLARVAKLCKI